MSWFGIIIVAVVVLGVFVYFRSRSRGSHQSAGLSSLTRLVGGRIDDIVRVGAEQMASKAIVVMGALHAPSILVLRATEAEAAVLNASPLAAKAALIKATNERLQARARRGNVPFVPLTAIDLAMPIAVGERVAIASFTPVDDPFGAASSTPNSFPDWFAEKNDDVPVPTDTIPVPTDADLPTVPDDDPPTRPLQSSVLIELTLAVPGEKPKTLAIPASANVPIRIGRGRGNDLVVPALDGISAQHATLIWSAAGLSVVDTSTWGTYTLSEGMWVRLPQRRETVLPEKAELALDSEGFVTVTVQTSRLVTA